jgi:hypothetical protein
MYSLTWYVALAFGVRRIYGLALRERRSTSALEKARLSAAAFLVCGQLLWFWTPEYYATNGFGPFVNRNHFAGWMVLAVGLSSGLLFGSVRRSRLVSLRSWRERVLWFGSPSASPVLLTAAATLAMACSLMWTMSRSGIIAAGVLACVLTVAATRASAGRAQRAFIAGCVLCAAVSVIAWRGARRAA